MNGVSVGLAVVLATALSVSGALARDRHVMLDTDGDGVLNDCPNPAHNTKGISGNTDDLKYCTVGSPRKLICDAASGCKSWTIKSASCGTSNVANLASAASVDLDGDVAEEPVYGHPQACVYSMAKSDTCEVHAGEYKRAGAVCAENCGASSVGGGNTTTCDQYDCWFASVAAFGYFADGHTDGYGTATAPGYLRGAVMNGSTDSWDRNGNKIADRDEALPDYAAILSGDNAKNGNTTFATTSCSGGTCSGDAFHAVLWGCGGNGSGGYGSILCRGTAFAAGEHGPTIDTNGDGTFDLEIGNAATTPVRNADYLTVKDLEFTGYNGGSSVTDDGSARYLDSTFSFNGNGSTAGIVVDHISMHDVDYSVGTGEIHWAQMGEHQNRSCPTPIQVRNSLLFVNNEKLYVSDLQSNVNDEPSSCSLRFHDNRVVFDWKSPRVRPTYAVLAYLKPVHTNASGGAGTEVVHRFYNNEFIVKTGAGGDFFDIQGFGGSTNKGQIWFYGNVVRESASMTSNLNNLFLGFCGAGTQGWNWFVLNNTFDVGKNQGAICGASGNKTVQKNNAWYRVTSVHPDNATTKIFQNEVCSAAQTSCTVPANTTRGGWFTTSALVSEVGGLAAYTPKAGGPLDNTGSCDPDGNGVAGMDYDGDGVNDQTWTDIAGNVVTCASVSTVADAGAIQSTSSGSNTPPGTVSGLRRGDAKP